MKGLVAAFLFYLLLVESRDTLDSYELMEAAERGKKEADDFLNEIDRLYMSRNDNKKDIANEALNDINDMALLSQKDLNSYMSEVELGRMNNKNFHSREQQKALEDTLREQGLVYHMLTMQTDLKSQAYEEENLEQKRYYQDILNMPPVNDKEWRQSKDWLDKNALTSPARRNSLRLNKSLKNGDIDPREILNAAKKEAQHWQDLILQNKAAQYVYSQVKGSNVYDRSK